MVSSRCSRHAHSCMVGTRVGAQGWQAGVRMGLLACGPVAGLVRAHALSACCAGCMHSGHARPYAGRRQRLGDSAAPAHLAPGTRERQRAAGRTRLRATGSRAGASRQTTRPAACGAARVRAGSRRPQAVCAARQGAGGGGGFGSERRQGSMLGMMPHGGGLLTGMPHAVARRCTRVRGGCALHMQAVHRGPDAPDRAPGSPCAAHRQLWQQRSGRPICRRALLIAIQQLADQQRLALHRRQRRQQHARIGGVGHGRRRGLRKLARHSAPSVHAGRTHRALRRAPRLRNATAEERSHNCGCARRGQAPRCLPSKRVNAPFNAQRARTVQHKRIQVQ